MKGLNRGPSRDGTGPAGVVFSNSYVNTHKYWPENPDLIGGEPLIQESSPATSSKNYSEALTNPKKKPFTPDNAINVSKILAFLKDLLKSLSKIRISMETQIFIINSFSSLLSLHE